VQHSKTLIVKGFNLCFLLPIGIVSVILTFRKKIWVLLFNKL